MGVSLVFWGLPGGGDESDAKCQGYEADELADGEGADEEAWVAAQVFDGEAEDGIGDEIGTGDKAALLVFAGVEGEEGGKDDGIGGSFEELCGDDGEGVGGLLGDEGWYGVELFPPGW